MSAGSTRATSINDGSSIFGHSGRPDARESLALSDSLADDAERDWSDWLQSGLAVKSTEPAVLWRLADHGRTKRIRRMARERLERLSS